MTSPESRQDHNRYQQQIFEREVDFFLKPIPKEVQRRTAQIVAAADLNAEDRVLDVGTGIGVLIPHIRRCGVADITGCDLSEPMLAEARKRYPAVIFWCGDVVDLPSELGPFDAIFFNAVFGNLWDQREVLRICTRLLAPRGRIVISHPMGADFAEKLAAQDSKMVPHAHPGRTQLAKMIDCLPLRVKVFRDEKDLYLCVLDHDPETPSF